MVSEVSVCETVRDHGFLNVEDWERGKVTVQFDSREDIECGAPGIVLELSFGGEVYLEGPVESLDAISGNDDERVGFLCPGDNLTLRFDQAG